MEPESQRRYWCFISYRHADNAMPGRQWATWIQRELEGFVVPRALVGRVNSRGEAIPEAIFPVFRDEEELPAYSDLSEAVVDALQRSLCMVVVCSPRACDSHFVDAEIRIYKSRGNAGRIFAAVIDGDPAGEGEACLPLALRRKVDSQANVTPEAESHPLLDFRDEGGGQSWTDVESHRRHLLEVGMAPDDADTEARERDSHLAAMRLSLVAAVLGVAPATLERALEMEMRKASRLRFHATWQWSLAAFVILAAAAGAIGISRAYTNISNPDSAATSSADNARTDHEHGMLLLTSDPAGAAVYLQRALDAGHLPSRTQLGILMAEGKLGPGRVKEGLRMLSQSADDHDTRALLYLGRLNLRVPADTRSVQRGVEFLLKGASLGDTGCQVELASAIAAGNPAEAERLLERAAAAGSAEAMWRLGSVGIRPSEGASRQAAGWAWIVQAAEKGHVQARRVLGRALCEGRKGPRDLAAGLAWLRKASEAGDAEAAQIMLGLHDDPSCVPSDPSAALAWHMDGVAQGHPDSMLRAARLLASQRRAEHLTQALGLIQRAAARGKVDEGRRLQGLLLRDFIFNAADWGGGASAYFPAEASRAALQGASQGDPNCMVAAAFTMVGLVDLSAGQAVQPGSAVDALAWLRRAAEHGDLSVRRDVATLMLTYPAIVPRPPDFASAMRSEPARLLLANLDKGDALSACLLVEWLFPQARTPDDCRVASELCLKGERIGDLASIYWLARMGAEGRGIRRDPALARERMARAVRAGYVPAAVDRLREIETTTATTEDREQAWILARLLSASEDHAKEGRAALARIESSMTPAQRLSAQQALDAFQARVLSEQRRIYPDPPNPFTP